MIKKILGAIAGMAIIVGMMVGLFAIYADAVGHPIF